MAGADFAARVRQARMTVTVRDPAWPGAARMGCTQWRLADWDNVPLAGQAHVVYIPGLLADYTPDAPLSLLRRAAKQGLPLVATVLDGPEYGAGRLPPGWAGRLARAGSLEPNARLLKGLIDQVVPGPYVIVGGSVGANLATILATIDEERVAGVQLCMPAGLQALPIMGGLVRGVVWTLLAGFRNPGYRRIALRGEAAAATYALLGSLPRLPVVWQVVRLLSQANALPYARRVRCPVALVLAERDAVFRALIPMHQRSELAALFPAAQSVRVHILQGADHSGLGAGADEMEGITLDLLATCRGDRRTGTGELR